MKYIQNNGRYAISYTIVKNGREAKIALDKKRIYRDTGNIATAGITAVEDEDFEELMKLPRFAKQFEDGELMLTEKSAVETAETKVADLEKENAELKAKLEAKDEAPSKKELKEKDKEIADLKAKLEALSKDNKGTDEAPKTETEGF